MNAEDLSVFAFVLPELRPKPELSCWDWTCENVDFHMAPKYRAASPGRFDPNLMPFWREPMNSVFDREIKEVVVWKPTQSGGSENMIVSPIRFVAATGTRAMLYASGQQEPTEEFFIERVKRGMLCSASTSVLMRDAVERGHVLDVGTSLIVCAWSKSGSGFKQRPFDMAFCDELSMWPDVSVVDEARKRFATRPFSKLVLVSSMDPRQNRPSEEDPIVIEYKCTDSCVWKMPDPVTGKLFEFRMGEEKDPSGLKWPEDCRRKDDSWDLERVSKEAYYVTPDGTRIDEKDRMRVVRSGGWVATNPNAPRWKRGYRFNQFILPWECGQFGHIAARFLESAAKGPASLRSFKYEVLSEEWYGERQIMKDVQIVERQGTYPRGKRASALPEFAPLYADRRGYVFVTVDVQKYFLPWVCREWFAPGDSNLIDFGEADRWETIKDVALLHGPSITLIDNSYADRKNEVIEQVARRVMRGAYILYGRDNLKDARTGSPLDFIESKDKDPFEGTRMAGRIKLTWYTYYPDRIKNILFRLIGGGDHAHSWRTFKDLPEEYIKQMTSEIWLDGKWIKVRRANHWWDCETMQVLAAMLAKVYEENTSTFGENLKAVPSDKLATAAMPSDKKAKEAPDPRVSYDPQSEDEDDEDSEW